MPARSGEPLRVRGAEAAGAQRARRARRARADPAGGDVALLRAGHQRDGRRGARLLRPGLQARALPALREQGRDREAYLRRFEDERLLAVETALDRADLAPRERLLAPFDALAQPTDRAARGCPYVGASVELSAPQHPAHELAAAHKRAFAERLAATAADAGARDPGELAGRLALLLDGAAAQSMVYDSTEPALAARAAAAALIDLATA